MTDSMFVNSIGISMHPIPKGEFIRGTDAGFWEERPAHKIVLPRAYYAAETPVTNAQYELYDPEHRKKRSLSPFCRGDNDPVTHVTHNEAQAFCRWLCEKEGRPYRLPTEAEWEYAMRGGSATDYLSGDAPDPVYLRNPEEIWYPDWAAAHDCPQAYAQDCAVGKTPQNAFGLRDVHGPVEQWCLDIYAAYPKDTLTDPICIGDGDFRVTRGGSHNTTAFYLRFGARMAAPAQTAHWFIGFRVFMGDRPEGVYRVPFTPGWSQSVKQENHTASHLDNTKPSFAGPLPYVRLEKTMEGPFFPHNHVPAVCECPNGDLLAIWFTCIKEVGREMHIVASRLRAGETEWPPAEPFWNPASRNTTGSAFIVDGQAIHHLNGISAAGTWGNLSLMHRVSYDNGATWSPSRIVNDRYNLRNMPIACSFIAKDGRYILPCDAVTTGSGGSCLHISFDRGETWEESGGTAKGIHCAVVELLNGDLLAIGRGDDIEGCMPLNRSKDGGKTWRTEKSPFASIGGGQRSTLLRLREGPILFASFTPAYPGGGTGLFAALSTDEGLSWEYKKLITPGEASAPLEGGAWTGAFTPSATVAEPKGYLTSMQTRDGTIMIFSSALQYKFNYAWLMDEEVGV